jgi:DNA repair exonuclease SbcCD ATPase subunit
MDNGKTFGLFVATETEAAVDSLQQSKQLISKATRLLRDFEEKRPGRIQELQKKIEKSEAAILETQKILDNLKEPTWADCKPDHDNLLIDAQAKFQSAKNQYKVDKWQFQKNIERTHDGIADKKRKIEEMQKSIPEEVNQLIKDLRAELSNLEGVIKHV